MRTVVKMRSNLLSPVHCQHEGRNIPYFAYGANMSSQKLMQRGVQPRYVGPAQVLDPLAVAFRHRNAFATLVPIESTETAGPLPYTHAYPHGVLYMITREDLGKLQKAEVGYKLRSVNVRPYRKADEQSVGDAARADQPETYEGPIAAQAFVSLPMLTLRASLPPTLQYLRLVREGAADCGLNASYVEWLNSLEPSPQGQMLGLEYQDTPQDRAVVFVLVTAITMVLCMALANGYQP